MYAITKYYLSSKASFLILLVSLTTAYGQKPHDLDYYFEQTDTSFCFVGCFPCAQLRTDCLLDIAFKYEHIKHFSNNATQVRLLHESKTTNGIEYTYEGLLVFKNISVWHRTLDTMSQMVRFQLISSINNNQLLPKIKNSYGHYKICKKDSITTMEYMQFCSFPKQTLSPLYVVSAKKEAITFLQEYSEYTYKHCIKDTSPTPKNYSYDF